ncbi:MAG: ribonuclease P protein component [Burkholderiales bacterium]|nr:ribonuclease P protein component [Burkholderiales bacterium]
MAHFFNQALRLNTADDFSSVFILRNTRNGKWLKIHYKLTKLGYSRLGLIVSKKNHKRANKRNYMKRVLRELFRCQQEQWLGYDIIVRVNKYFTVNDFNEVKQEFIQLTNKFIGNVNHG